MMCISDFFALYDSLEYNNKNIWSAEEIRKQGIKNGDEILKLLSHHDALRLRLSYALEYDSSVVLSTLRLRNSDTDTLEVCSGYDSNIFLLNSFCPLRSIYRVERNGYRWYSQPIVEEFFVCYNALYSLLNKVYSKELLVHIYMKGDIPVVDVYSVSIASVGLVETISYGSNKRLDSIIEKAINRAERYKQVIGEFYFLLRKDNDSLRMYAREKTDGEYVISFF